MCVRVHINETLNKKLNFPAASTLVELVDRRVPNLKERHRVVSQPLSARVCEERMLCSTPFQHHHEDGLNAQLAACSLGHLDGH